MNKDPTLAPRSTSRVGTLVREPRTVQPTGAFASVLCAFDRSAHGRAAHEQAMVLAAPEAALELVPCPELTQHGSRALHDACQEYDLLALGADAAALVAVEHAPICVLLARWCPLGTDVTDTILVPHPGGASARPRTPAGDRRQRPPAPRAHGRRAAPLRRAASP